MWTEVKDDLPDDGVEVMVYLRRKRDSFYDHDLSSFKRSFGWDIDHGWEVVAWSYYHPYEEPKCEEPEKEEKKQPAKKWLFNTWHIPK